LAHRAVPPTLSSGRAEIDSIPPAMLFCFRFKFDINEYLPRLAPDAQVKTLEDIIKSGKFHPSIEKRLIDRQAERRRWTRTRAARKSLRTRSGCARPCRR
jgi:hypothetical protein